LEADLFRNSEALMLHDRPPWIPEADLFRISEEVITPRSVSGAAVRGDSSGEAAEPGRTLAVCLVAE
jgi:hypothetical protein